MPYVHVSGQEMTGKKIHNAIAPRARKNVQLPQAVSNLHACEVGAKHCQATFLHTDFSIFALLKFLTSQVSARVQRSKNGVVSFNRKGRKVLFAQIASGFFDGTGKSKSSLIRLREIRTNNLSSGLGSLKFPGTWHVFELHSLVTRRCYKLVRKL